MIDPSRPAVDTGSTAESSTYAPGTRDKDYPPARAQAAFGLEDIANSLGAEAVAPIGGGTPPLLAPASRNAQAIQRKFNALADEWEADTRFESMVLNMVTHPAYQQIIGIGPDAVPLILHRLSQRLDHWFWALRAVTGEDPAPEESRGNLEAMAQAWLEWGREQGYEFS